MSNRVVTNPYSLPHGSTESDRLDVQHRAIMRLIGDKLFHAPITAPSNILDIGCGSGIATLELAKRFPSARVVGVDLAPVSGLQDRPSNLSFLQGPFAELVETGQLEANTFDYIFSRMLVLGVVDWKSHTSTAASLLRAGGWLEVQDLSFHVYNRNGVPVDDRYSYIKETQIVAAERGLDPFCGENLARYLDSAGLQTISYNDFPFAWTTWKERPETELIAAHQCSTKQIQVRNSMIENLLGTSGKYTAGQIAKFKAENAESHKDAEEGIHSIYGVAYGRK